MIVIVAIIIINHHIRISYPIYIVRGMAERALNFFRIYSSWSSEAIRKAEDPWTSLKALSYRRHW